MSSARQGASAIFDQNPRKKWQWHCHYAPTLGNNSFSYRAAHMTGNNYAGYVLTASATGQMVTVSTHFAATHSSFVAEVNLPGEKDSLLCWWPFF
jgi:hypothetical protein